MDAETIEIIAQNPDIDRRVCILVRLLSRATAEKLHGRFGIEVSVHEGQLRKTKEINEVTHN